MIWKIIIVLTIVGLIFGIVFVGAFSNVLTDYYAIQREDIQETNTLKIIWKINLADQLISTPQTQNGIIFIQTQHKVTAINYLTREQIWEFPIEAYKYNCSFVSTPNYIFIPSIDGMLITVDAKTGKELWARPKSLTHERIEDIRVQNDYIVLATYNRNLESRNINSGEIEWQIPVPERSALNLMIVEDTILLSSNGQLTAYKLNDGQLIWSRNFDLGVSLFEPTGKLLIVHESRQNSEWISGIDPFSGETIWATQIPFAKVNCIVNSKDYLLIAGEGLLSFDLRSKLVKWENQKIDDLTCPIVLRGKIFVRKELRDLYIFDSQSGILDSRYSLNWTLFLDNNKFIEPVVIDNMIILPRYRSSLVIVNSE